MVRLNRKVNPMTETTHEGAPAYGNLKPIQALRRSVMSCFLWESEFYEDGQEIAKRILDLASKCKPADVAALAIEARTKGNLRHVPLLLLCALAKIGSGTAILSHTIPQVINRADELSELIAVYWRDGKKPLPAQMKKGLAKAFQKFNEYQLAKYNRDNAIKLRDVLFMVHAKPKDGEAVDLYKRLAEKELKTPDTWEVALSGGADKKETFTRLINEGQLGYFAVLRNLRNMEQAGVERSVIRKGLTEAKGFDQILPFRFVAAARACPTLEPDIDKALLRKISTLRKLPGKTIVLVDVSGSMDANLSGKSDLRRCDAAAALASIINADELKVFSFSINCVECPPRKGMAGVDAILNSQGHGGTDLGGAVTMANKSGYDRLIVITDEQSHSTVPGPKGKGYMINVASHKNGVGYGPWVHIDGFTERVLDFIYEYENQSLD